MKIGIITFFCHILLNTYIEIICRKFEEELDFGLILICDLDFAKFKGQMNIKCYKTFQVKYAAIKDFAHLLLGLHQVVKLGIFSTSK